MGISSPILFYLARNTQYSSKKPYNKAFYINKISMNNVICTCISAIRLTFSTYLFFLREVLIITNLFAVAGFICCLLFLPFISILRGYELFFQNKKIIFCQGITANIVSIVCILFFS